MIRTKGRRRLTCWHEAGHALVRWYFGHRTDRAVVLTVEEVRAGQEVENRRGVMVSCEGMVDGYDICGFPFGPLTIAGTPAEQDRVNHLRRIDRDIELMNCQAGFYAEAVYRRASVFTCALTGGTQDLRHARDLLDAWGLPEPERHAVTRDAEVRASALVRSRPGSTALKAIAGALMDKGEIDGEEIGRLCRSAYGGRECAFGGWDGCWPPSLAQIRAGFIPTPPDQEVRAA